MTRIDTNQPLQQPDIKEKNGQQKPHLPIERNLAERFRNWLQQPTTLSGLSIFIAGLIGIWSGALSEDLGCTVLTAALPLLLPDNTTARRITQASIMPLTEILARHHHTLPESVQEPEPVTEHIPQTLPEHPPIAERESNIHLPPKFHRPSPLS